MNIYYTILAQAVRLLLRAAAAYLTYIGITGEQQSEFVEVTVGIIVPILLVLLAEGWSYLQKRYFPVLLNTAIKSNAFDTIEDVKMRAAKKTNAPVIY